jgi:hypothetical protein
MHRALCVVPPGSVLLGSGDGAVQPGEETLALGGHATEEIEGTVAETLDTGVIFTVENRVSLSDRGNPRVLLAIVGTFIAVVCRPGPAVVLVLVTPGAGPFHVV